MRNSCSAVLQRLVDGEQPLSGAAGTFLAEIVAAEIVLILFGLTETLAGDLPAVLQGELRQETNQCLGVLDSTLDSFEAESSDFSSDLHH